MSNNFSLINANWKYVLPPSRPSLIELNRIQNILFNIDKDEPIAILGSTIEFRNLLHQMGFSNIYIFEKNNSFYEWTKTWIAYEIDEEKVIWGDWLYTIEKYKNYFKVCLSDLTMGNIDYINRRKFYNDIYDSLKYGGIFIDKLLIHNIEHEQLNSLIYKYEKTPINLQTINNFSCEVLFCSSLLNGGIVDTTKFYSYLSEQYKSEAISKYLELAHLITPEDCIWYYGKKWSEIKEDYLRPYKKMIIYDDVLDSPYYNRAKQFIQIK